MRYAQTRQFDVANGEGIGCTLFVSGCKFNCTSCFNKDYQDFEYGQLWNKRVETQFIEMCKNPQVDHIAILGGEPMMQDVNMYYLLMNLKYEVGKPVWLWTGFTWEELMKKPEKHWLNYIDILIDGRFENDKRDLTLKWRGSSNQRVINVKESIEQNKVVLYCD